MGRFHKSMFSHLMMQTLYTRDNLKPSSWIILVQQTENSISQRLHGYCFYLQLLSSVQHKLITSLDSKVCSQRCNKWIISSKSLLMLSVNNYQFNYYSILSDYMYTKCRKSFDNIIIGLITCVYFNIITCVNFWRGVLTFKSFLGDSSLKNYIKQMWFLKFSLRCPNP